MLRYKYIEETLIEQDEAHGDTKTAAGDILAGFKETLTNLPVELWVFLAIDFIFTFAWAVTEPYFVTYAKEEVNLNAAQWGLIAMAVTLISTTLKPPAAYASDRHGRIKFIFACMFIWPGAFLLFVNARNFQAILMARLLIAVSSSIGDPAWEALFVDYSPKEYRGRFNAISSISWAIIWAAGNVLGGAIYQGYSKRMIFNLSAALFAIGIIVALIKVREPKRREN
jgi:MFS family permease